MIRRNSLDRALNLDRMESTSDAPPMYDADMAASGPPPPPPSYEAAIALIKKSNGHRPEMDTDQNEQETNIDRADGALTQEERRSQERVRRRARRLRDESNIGREEAFELEMMDLDLDSNADESAYSYLNSDEEDEQREVEMSFIESRPENREGDTADGHSLELGSRGHSPSRRSTTYECETFPILTPVISYVVKTFNEASKRRKILIILGVFLFLGLLLFVSLFPASFIYVDYDKMGFSRNKMTGVHDYSQVYQSGCYLLAPQDEVVTFPATAHFLQLDLSVMNAAGMSIGLKVNLQYFLKPEELHLLFQKYNFGYPQVISNVAESTVKNAAIEFEMDQYRLNRSFVEAQIFRRLKLSLSGNCCAPCCPSCARNNVGCGVDHCQAVNCSSGYHVDARYFQLGDVTIPKRVLNRYMTQVLMQIETEKEQHIQDIAVQRITTEFKVRQQLNKANEIRKAAEADKHLIKVTAEATTDRDVQVAYLKSVQKFFNHMNITDEDDKISFIYTKALKDASHNLYAYSYNYGGKTAMSP